jgi:hypothetical protein
MVKKAIGPLDALDVVTHLTGRRETNRSILAKGSEVALVLVPMLLNGGCGYEDHGHGLHAPQPIDDRLWTCVEIKESS